MTIFVIDAVALAPRGGDELMRINLTVNKNASYSHFQNIRQKLKFRASGVQAAEAW
jgi:hypothetical protein